LKKILLTFIIQCLICLIVLSCTDRQESQTLKNTQTQSRSQNVEVIVHEVQKGPVYKTYTAVGSVSPSDLARITPKVAGRIKEIYVEEGDNIAKGKLLMLIDTFDYERSLENTSSVAKQAKATLARANRDLLRTQALYKNKAISEQSCQDAMTSRDLAQHRYDQALIAETIATRNLKECRVSAPISGVITEKLINKGEITGPQQLSFVIMQMDKVKVEVDLPEEIYGFMKEGNGSIIELDAIPTETFNGTITKIYPTIDRLSRSFKVTITIDNPGLKIRSGMTARSKVIQKALDSATSIPKSALMQGDEGYYVFVAADDKVRRVQVETGIEGDSLYEATKGVSEGDLVVITGLAGLKDGMKVSISRQVQ